MPALFTAICNVLSTCFLYVISMSNVIDHRAGQLAAACRRKVLYTDFEALLSKKSIYIFIKKKRLFLRALSRL